MKGRKQKNIDFFDGIRSGIPILIGFFPIATTFAIMAATSGLTTMQCNLMSIMVLAGASQMMAVSMLAAQCSYLQIILAVFFLNLRHFIMSSCVMKRMKHTPLKQKLLMSFAVTDESFAIYTSAQNENKSDYFFAGLGLMTYGSWVLGTVAGSFFIQFIPQKVAGYLVIALYAMFIQLIVPEAAHSLKIALIVLCSITMNCILSSVISSGWSMILSMLIASAFGCMLDHVILPGQLQKQADNS